MRFSFVWRTMIGSAMALGLAGCASDKPKLVEKTTSITQDAYGSIKAAYLTANPNARVGRVAAVLANRLSVNDIPLADFRKGDVVSIVDDKLNPIATGSVIEIDSDYLYVDFEPETATSRAPVVGDMAIRAETPVR
jgi:starvation-inducible outer membrane lipoprotein